MLIERAFSNDRKPHAIVKTFVKQYFEQYLPVVVVPVLFERSKVHGEGCADILVWEVKSKTNRAKFFSRQSSRSFLTLCSKRMFGMEIQDEEKVLKLFEFL